MSTKSVTNSIKISKTEDVKVSGFIWNCESEPLKYRVNLPTDNNKITKRFILSTVAKLFNPLGLINPARRTKCRLLLPTRFEEPLIDNNAYAISVLGVLVATAYHPTSAVPFLPTQDW